MSDHSDENFVAVLLTAIEQTELNIAYTQELLDTHALGRSLSITCLPRGVEDPGLHRADVGRDLGRRRRELGLRLAVRGREGGEGNRHQMRQLQRQLALDQHADQAQRMAAQRERVLVAGGHLADAEQAEIAHLFVKLGREALVAIETFGHWPDDVVGELPGHVADLDLGLGQPHDLLFQNHTPLFDR